jgi:type II secretory pathway pseudopilin PulG
VSTSEEQDERRDAGMTLAELLVTMGLLGLLTTLVATVVVLGLRVSTTTQQRLDDSTQGELAVMTSSKLLRTAVRQDQLEDLDCDTCVKTAIVRASAHEVTFYANLDNTGQGPSLVTLTVLEDPRRPGSGILRQRTQAPTAVAGGGYTYCNPTTTGCTVRSRTVVAGLVWPVPASFTYYDFAGSPITRTLVGQADLNSVASIDVTFSVRTARGNDPTAAVQRVRLPNADISDPDEAA